MKPCACGCGVLIPEKDKRGRPRKYDYGHNNKGKSNWWKITSTPTGRTSRARARQQIDTRQCRLGFIGGCKGKIDAAHLDGDMMNNDPANVWPLCKSHHRLVDNGRIDPHNPTMPKFYVSAGKRRYEYHYSHMDRSTACRLREARKREDRSPW